MTEIPNVLTGLPVPDQVSSLLLLGWTHEEIATATDVSKGTVQNYKDDLMDGKISVPPAAIGIVRSREREFHRASAIFEGKVY